MKKDKACCFTGHRKIPDNHFNYLNKRLNEEIINLIHKGVLYFYSGGALGFDTLAAKAVLKLKRQFPKIQLILLLPCKNQTKYWKISDINTYEQIKSSCDKYIYVSKEYSRDCMHKRNRLLVEKSSYCITYFCGRKGGTDYTINYALQKNLKIINIAKE